VKNYPTGTFIFGLAISIASANQVGWMRLMCSKTVEIEDKKPKKGYAENDKQTVHENFADFK
jgi:hypothetical protein